MKVKIKKATWFIKMMNEIKKTPEFKKETKQLKKEWNESYP